MPSHRLGLLRLVRTAVAGVGDFWTLQARRTQIYARLRH